MEECHLINVHDELTFKLPESMPDSRKFVDISGTYDKAFPFYDQ